MEQVFFISGFHLGDHDVFTKDENTKAGPIFLLLDCRCISILQMNGILHPMLRKLIGKDTPLSLSILYIHLSS